MKIRIAGIDKESIVNGEGFRLTVFFQGCPHKCKGCHNPQTWDFDGGYEIDTKEIIQMMCENPLLDGITLSGGEPFSQMQGALELARAAHKANLTVWCYTGHTFEGLQDWAFRNWDSVLPSLLKEIDVLIDGEFILEQKTLDLPWRGSKNQRMLQLYKGEIESVL